MTDFVVDKSVLETSSGPAPGGGCGALEVRRVLDWLDAFRSATADSLALDQGFAIWADYLGLGGQNYGLLVLQEKLRQGALRTEPVRQTVDGRAMVAGEWGHLDEHRRRLLLVAQNRPAAISVANATHEDWHPSRCPANPGAVVHQILAKWLNARIAAAAAAAPGVTVRSYVPAPQRLQGQLAAAARTGIGVNGRRSWEDGNRRYEWDYQHGTVEVYAIPSGQWLHEARPDGTVTKATRGRGRRWGRP